MRGGSFHGGCTSTGAAAFFEDGDACVDVVGVGRAPRNVVNSLRMRNDCWTESRITRVPDGGATSRRHERLMSKLEDRHVVDRPLSPNKHTPTFTYCTHLGRCSLR